MIGCSQDMTTEVFPDGSTYSGQYMKKGTLHSRLNMMLTYATGKQR